MSLAEQSSFWAVLGISVTIVAALVTIFVVDPLKHPAVRPVVAAATPLIILFIAYEVIQDRSMLEESERLAKRMAILEHASSDKGEECEPLYILQHPLAPPATTAPATSTSTAPTEECKSAAAQAIAAMILRCGTARHCETLPDVSKDEYHELMSTLPLAAIFFPNGNSDTPINDISKLDSFFRLAKDSSIFIIVSRTSNTGSFKKNKKISLKRAIFARDRLEQIAPQTVATMASYADKALYLSELDAKTYGLDPRDYKGTIQYLNQSVFAYRFDCSLGPK